MKVSKEKLQHVKLHAKLILAEGNRAIVGSINLAPGSFDSRRELAIEVRDEHVTSRIDEVLHHDWENSKALDLSDEALLKELQKTDKDAAEDLGLQNHKHRGHEKK
jgi:cardiolipin synthase